MVFTGLFACCFLREPCGIFEITIVIFTLSGVTIVVQPEFLFGAAHVATTVTMVDEYMRYMAAAGIMAGAMVSSLGYIATRLEITFTYIYINVPHMGIAFEGRSKTSTSL